MTLMRARTFALALCLSACRSGQIGSEWTEYGKRMTLVPRAEDCQVYVVRDPRGLAPVIPVARMTYWDDSEDFYEDGIEEFRAEACRLGADGFVLDVVGQPTSQTRWTPVVLVPSGEPGVMMTREDSKGIVVASAFVWARRGAHGHGVPARR
jgi:hypothetical protein